MIAMAVFFALSAVFIMGLRVFWRTIVEWIKKASSRIQEVLGVAVEGTKTFIVMTQDGLKNKSIYYNRNKITKEWEETVYTKKVNESEVPEEIKAKVKAQPIGTEVSTTEELRLELEA